MGIALGKAQFSDGTQMHFEFQTTSDYVFSRLHESQPDHVGNNADCTCGNGEPVNLAVDYGSGFHWTGTACRKCHAITSGHDVPEAACHTVLPAWYGDNIRNRQRARLAAQDTAFQFQRREYTRG